MPRSTGFPILASESGLSLNLKEIRRFPMLEPQEEFMLAKRWREHGDRDAAHRLVTSHLRLVAKIAMGYRGYGLPIADVISEGNVGLMQAVKRFEPDKGFRLATYGMGWIKAAIQEYLLRSWSLVKMGTTANQKKLFFNLRKAKSSISALDEGDMRPDEVKLIAKRLGAINAQYISSGESPMANVVKKHSISSELAQKMVDEAVAKARELGVTENVAILDDGGNLKAFSRMDGAPILSIEMAQNKAYTALFGVSTQDFFNFIQGDPALLAGIPTLARVAAWGGEFPIKVNGEVVGAIGLSGAPTVQNDVDCARAALALVPDAGPTE
jgi:RNA polymerase sigma-32 factor